MNENEEVRLHKLQVYYNYFKLNKKYGWTFSEFVKLVDNGTYAEIQAGL